MRKEENNSKEKITPPVHKLNKARIEVGRGNIKISPRSVQLLFIFPVLPATTIFRPIGIPRAIPFER